jgi:hypothetical protein
MDGEKVRVPRLRLGAGTVRVEVGCATEFEACTRRAVLRANGAELGRSPERTTAGRRLTLTVRLRRPLAPGPAIAVQIRGADRDPGYPSRRYGFRYLLIRPGR